MMVSPRHDWLLGLARDCGDRYFDAATRLCLIQRDTLWYASALLHDADPARCALGLALITEARSGDGTHTPATLLALLHGCRALLDDAAVENIRTNIAGELHRAALVEWHDGNVNHPLGAWATLVLGGELLGEQWAVRLGRSRLARFRATIGDRRHAGQRQTEMSEYCSPTYTALDLCFLALLAEYAEDCEARLLAAFLEEQLWIDTALNYHAPSAQFAGPHSRSYQDDSSGGWSGLHAVFVAAFDRALPLDPGTALRFEHPSALLQNGLVAITPFHAPDQARRIAFDKPFPYEVRRTTYGEAYHENNAAAGFGEEVYPGGWSQLTTYMTDEYALGTATLPYVNAGHSDAFMLRLRRSANPCCTGEIRSLFCRGVYNEAEVGQRNHCHVTGGDTDASFLYEEGRTAMHQHRNKAIVLYAPKRAGHAGVRSFRVDVLMSPALPFDALRIGGADVSRFPHEADAGESLYFQDGDVYVAIHPMDGAVGTHGRASLRGVGTDDVGTDDVGTHGRASLLRVVSGHYVFSMYAYRGPERDFDAEDIASWRCGFAIEIATARELPSFDAFVERARLNRLEEIPRADGVRDVRFTTSDGTMRIVHDPRAERILAREWNGQDLRFTGFQVLADPLADPVLAPAELFGMDAWAEFRGRMIEEGKK